MPCAHVFADPRRSCPHAVGEGQELCLWHNPAVLKNVPYVRAVFERADQLSGPAAFAEAHLAGIDLKDLDLASRDFSGADLRDAVLDGCTLTGADLRRANLRRASLRHAKLAGADLSDCDLTGTSLVGADLRGAILRGARIDGTTLLAADLRDADLAGAEVTGFHWNRLTRFAGLKGLDAQPGSGDTTQVFLAPMAHEDLDTPARQAFDRDLDLERTRLFRCGPLTGATFAETAVMELPGAGIAPAPVGEPLIIREPAGRRWPWIVIPALVGVLVGAGVATLSQVQPERSADAVADLTALRLQREADLGELKRLQGQNSEMADALATLKQASAGERARAVQLDQQLQEAQAEVSRLRDADDRATVAALRSGELDVLTRDLGKATAKQERLAKILADGVERTQNDNRRLSVALADARARGEHAEQLAGENQRLGRQVAALRQERDGLANAYQTARADLDAARKDVQRYLARIGGSQLQSLLPDDDKSGTLVPLAAGKPVSLGGDYLVSLTVDKASGPTAAVDLSLVIQRPAAAANPDAMVVLYDEKRRPLRRFTTSFPHVDQGAPFVRVSATVSCDRIPAFARIQLTPGLDDVAVR